MAESAVKSSIDVLGKILVEEGKYLWGAEGKVKELRNELLWMRSFLRRAETLQDKDEIVWMWVCQVQEHVYEAEDIMDKFLIQVVSRRRQNGFWNKLRRYSCFLRELYYLRWAASSIDYLKDEISTLSPRLERYGPISSISGKKDQVEEARVGHMQPIFKNAYLEDKKIIGFENNAKEIINNLTSPGKRFHAIYTMGGGGKTTLATKVFKDDAVKEHFSGGQAFAYISKQFHVGSVIEEVHAHLKLHDPKTENKSLVVQVQEFLKENKCLVVLDDVWKKEDWDCLKSAFALGDGDSGTKVLLTTRNKEVAEHVDSGARRMPDPLKYEDAWELFQRTMGWDVLKASSTSSKQVQDQTKTDGTNDGSNVLLNTSKEDVAKHPIEVPESSTSSSEIQEQTNTDDIKDAPEKIKLAKKMLKVCRGIPLFIVVLGGILRKKQTLDGWKSVLDNITWHLRAGYDHGRSCTEILLQSYNDLPYYLKPCFLQLANFPEDYEISTQSLYRMWVAEGLVTWSRCGRATRTKCLEDVANDYLNDLAQVGLVEIVDVTSEGWINSIRMHDLVRDVCYEQAATDNVLKAIDLPFFLCCMP